MAGGTGQPGGKWKVAFLVSRLVNVTSITRRDGRLRGTITAYQRPPSQVSPGDAASLRSAFAAFARSDPGFRSRVRHPDFEAERVMAIQSLPALTSLVLRHVDMPAATRARLLPLSDAERTRELLALLKTAESPRDPSTAAASASPSASVSGPQQGSPSQP